MSAASRLQPLLRLNEWRQLETRQRLVECRSDLEAATARRDDCVRRLDATFASLGRITATGVPIDLSRYHLLGDVAGGALGAARRVEAECAAKQAALEAQSRAVAGLRRERDVLDRRARELQEGAAAVAQRQDQESGDELWLLTLGSRA